MTDRARLIAGGLATLAAVGGFVFLGPWATVAVIGGLLLTIAAAWLPGGHISPPPPPPSPEDLQDLEALNTLKEWHPEWFPRPGTIVEVEGDVHSLSSYQSIPGDAAAVRRYHDGILASVREMLNDPRCEVDVRTGTALTGEENGYETRACDGSLTLTLHIPPAPNRDTWNRFRQAARDAAGGDTPNVPDGFRAAFRRFQSTEPGPTEGP